VLALEAAGCELLALPVDLAQPGRVAAAVERARQRFGGIDGVVHAAFEAGAGLLQWKSREQAAAVLAPAVAGTLALAAATAATGAALDCFVLCGSSAAATGGFGQGDTAAAAAFLDAFAAAREAAGAPFTLAIDWGLLRWQPVTVDDPALAAQLRQGLAAYGIAADDFAPAFERALASRLPQVVVSPLDLPAVIAELAAFGAFPSVNVATAAGMAGLGGGAGSAHPRPELPTAFEPAEGPEEEAIAAVWAEAFGLDRVGRRDNFFDLGGNSLVAIQVVTRLVAEHGMSLSMASLLEAPTVALLARRLPTPAPAPEPAAGADLERLLAEIEAVGEAGAEEVLAREGAAQIADQMADQMAEIEGPPA
jgi:mycoketide-CoA synthase